MTKAARRLAFALKATEPLGIAAHFGREKFDGDAIAEQDVARAIDSAHAAFAEQVLDLVLAVEDATHERIRIFLEDLAVFRTKAEVIVVLVVAGRAELHACSSLQRKCQKPDCEGGRRLRKNQGRRRVRLATIALANGRASDTVYSQ